MNALAVHDLGMSYNGARDYALKEVSFSLENNHICAVTGESGSGKSTLLRLVAGLEVPDHGSIHIGDQQVAGDRSFTGPEKRNIGLVFQDHALFPHMTVARNITFGIPRDPGKEKRMMELLELVGLSGLGDRYPHQLSGGQQQRIALARALAPSPGLLLLDEPFSNLDASLKLETRRELFRILRETGQAVLFVTHDMSDAMAAADQVLVLNKGRAVQYGTPGDLFRSPASTYVAELIGGFNSLTEADCLAMGIQEQGKVGCRPDSLIMSRTEKEGYARGIVEGSEYQGAFSWLYVKLDGGSRVRCECSHEGITTGTAVWLGLGPDSLLRF